MMEFVINAISKNYRNNKILDNISFTAESGKCVGILGENGCGKTTLLKILSGILKPDRGELLFDGLDLLKDYRHRADIVGYVPQEIPLIEELTVLDNLRLYHSKNRIFDDSGKKILEMLKLTGYLKMPVRKLSGGMKKRVTIATAVIGRPLLLLMDEPTASLDIECKSVIREYISDYKKDGTIILVTHDTEEMGLCDEKYVIANGCLSVGNKSVVS